MLVQPENREFEFRSRLDGSVNHMTQFHFHWLGSEFQLDGEQFGAELHLVFKDLNHTSTGNFSVISFFFEVDFMIL